MCGLKLSCSGVCCEWYRRVSLFLPFVKSRSNLSVTFQRELKQWSAIHQHFSRGLKDQHLVLPAQRDHSSFAIPFTRFIMRAWRLPTVPRSGWCRYVIRRGLRNCACVCQPICAARPGPALRPSVCVCVCVFLMCRLFSDSQCRCWATWLRTGGALVYLPTPNTHTHKKQIIHTHLRLNPENTRHLQRCWNTNAYTHKCTTHTFTYRFSYTLSQTECALLKTWLWLTLVAA